MGLDDLAMTNADVSKLSNYKRVLENLLDIIYKILYIYIIIYIAMFYRGLPCFWFTFS
jgi:hypothetical protein